jgi:hypothetical protein
MRRGFPKTESNNARQSFPDTREPNITQNDLLRTPQREAYAELVNFAANPEGQDREIGIVLPVGCGKSGCYPRPVCIQGHPDACYRGLKSNGTKSYAKESISAPTADLTA